MASPFVSQTTGKFIVLGPDPAMVQSAIEDLYARKIALDTVLTRSRAVPLYELRVHDAIKTDLPDTPGTDDMGLAEAVGSAALGVITADDDQTGYALFLLELPEDYKAGTDLTIVLRAKTTGLGQVANVFDIEAKLVGDAAVGSDICATAAQTVTTSYANYSFTITGTSLAAGDVLQVRIRYNMNDTGGGGSAGTATLAKVSFSYTAYGVSAPS